MIIVKKPSIHVTTPNQYPFGVSISWRPCCLPVFDFLDTKWGVMCLHSLASSGLDGGISLLKESTQLFEATNWRNCRDPPIVEALKASRGQEVLIDWLAGPRATPPPRTGCHRVSHMAPFSPRYVSHRLKR